jgi:hypothetical protein
MGGITWLIIRWKQVMAWWDKPAEEEGLDELDQEEEEW